MTRTQKIGAGAGAVVVALVGLVVLLTRGGGEEAAPPTTPEPTTTTTGPPTTTTTTVPGPTYPLTGRSVEDPARAGRPTLIVKIDNVDGVARPQAGVNEADLVYEELVEGGVTRFAAVYHSRDAVVGPVRSARTTDIAIGTQFGRPLFAFSGANQIFMELIRASPLVELSYDWNPQLYTRVPDRPAPDNVFMATDAIYAANPGDATPPPEVVFTFRGAGDERPASAIDVTGVRYSFGGAGAEVAFTWDADRGGWRRDQNGTPHVDTADEVIAPQNLIIQNVEYVDSGARDVAGTPVPEAQMVGEGEVLVFTDGHAIPGRWSRPTADDVTTFTDADGDPIALTPGQTWVSLLRPGIAQLLP